MLLICPADNQRYTAKSHFFQHVSFLKPDTWADNLLNTTKNVAKENLLFINWPQSTLMVTNSDCGSLQTTKHFCGQPEITTCYLGVRETTPFIFLILTLRKRPTLSFMATHESED